MRIWVDADACPKVIKEILFRAAERRQISLTLVANSPLHTPRSTLIKSVRVASGFDVADNYIAARVAAEELVITADIPLAAAVIDKQAYALNPRGEFYTTENIRETLNMRDFMEQMRNIGEISGGPPPLNQADRRAFANALDRFLTRQLGRA